MGLCPHHDFELLAFITVRGYISAVLSYTTQLVVICYSGSRELVPTRLLQTLVFQSRLYYLWTFILQSHFRIGLMRRLKDSTEILFVIPLNLLVNLGKESVSSELNNLIHEHWVFLY